MEKELLAIQEARRATWVGFSVNAVLTLLKFLAGIFGHSAAMIADAVHSLSDFLTDIVLLVSLRFSGIPADESHNYGRGKYETVATIIISVFLFIAGYQILKTGILRIMDCLDGGCIKMPGKIALYAAVLSVISNEVLFRYTIKLGRKINSPGLIANAWHHRSDAFSSLATMVGIAAAIFLGDRWAILDPLTSIVVAAFIFKVALDILLPSFQELVEKSLGPEQRSKVEEILSNNECIKEFHKLRMRRVGSKVVVESHILVEETLTIKEAHDIANEVEKAIDLAFDGQSLVNMHLEPYNEEESLKYKSGKNEFHY